VSGTSAWGTILKHTLNPLTLRAARRGRGPFSIVTSVGRKTGKTYETPIIVQPTEGGFMIELTYGDRVHWYRNIVAAGGCKLTYKGIEYDFTGVEPVGTAAGLAAFPASQQWILTLLHRQHFVRFLTK
jgi:deazaflavin-dependent oxidoreductase (nitroreductase family)